MFVSLAPNVLALLLAIGALAVALSALAARSAYLMCIRLAAMGGLAASAMLALGAGGGALPVALLIAALAPVLLLGGVLLIDRTAKTAARGAPWLTMLAAAAIAGATIWAMPGLAATMAIAWGSQTSEGSGVWMAVLMLVAVAASVGLLGYGERGALRRNETEGGGA